MKLAVQINKITGTDFECANVKEYPDGATIPDGWMEWSLDQYKEWQAIQDANVERQAHIYKLKHPTEEWDAFLLSAFPDPVTGILLANKEETKRRVAETAILLRELTEAGMSGDTELTLWDYYNKDHKVTITQARGIFIRYGLNWMANYNALAP